MSQDNPINESDLPREEGQQQQQHVEENLATSNEQSREVNVSVMNPETNNSNNSILNKTDDQFGADPELQDESQIEKQEINQGTDESSSRTAQVGSLPLQMDTQNQFERNPNEDQPNPDENELNIEAIEIENQPHQFAPEGFQQIDPEGHDPNEVNEANPENQQREDLTSQHINQPIAQSDQGNQQHQLPQHSSQIDPEGHDTNEVNEANPEDHQPEDSISPNLNQPIIRTTEQINYPQQIALRNFQKNDAEGHDTNETNQFEGGSQNDAEDQQLEDQPSPNVNQQITQTLQENQPHQIVPDEHINQILAGHRTNESNIQAAQLGQNPQHQFESGSHDDPRDQEEHIDTDEPVNQPLDGHHTNESTTQANQRVNEPPQANFQNQFGSEIDPVDQEPPFEPLDPEELTNRIANQPHQMDQQSDPQIDTQIDPQNDQNDQNNSNRSNGQNDINEPNDPQSKALEDDPTNDAPQVVNSNQDGAEAPNQFQLPHEQEEVPLPEVEEAKASENPIVMHQMQEKAEIAQSSEQVERLKSQNEDLALKVEALESDIDQIKTQKQIELLKVQNDLHQSQKEHQLIVKSLQDQLSSAKEQNSQLENQIMQLEQTLVGAELVAQLKDIPKDFSEAQQWLTINKETGKTLERKILHEIQQLITGIMSRYTIKLSGQSIDMENGYTVQVFSQEDMQFPPKFEKLYHCYEKFIMEMKERLVQFSRILPLSEKPNVLRNWEEYNKGIQIYNQAKAEARSFDQLIHCAEIMATNIGRLMDALFGLVDQRYTAQHNKIKHLIEQIGNSKAIKQLVQ